MEFVFDTETTGLPQKRGYAFDSPKNLASYEGARLVSISWIVSHRHSPVKQAYYVIRPDGFIVTPESTTIHGISHEQAMVEGVPIHTVLEEIKMALQGCTSLVAHNISFDVHILQSEAYRYGDMELYDIIDNMIHICTMQKGKEVMAQKRYPKLEALYKHLHDGEEIVHAHNAQYDTLHCFKCYTKMFPVDRSVFFFGDTMVKLTSEQLDIVDEDINTHMIVIACAGSGKTTTMLCRIKHLLDQGIEERSIMLTAFTRDAANDMKNKLFNILGYKPAITVNTIDSISKMYIERAKRSLSTKDAPALKDVLKDVSQYNYMFLEAIRADPSIIQKYKYLFVDEFQDINDVQFQIFYEFVKQGAILFGVGDDAQNIYTFRGSNVKYILDFESFFEQKHVSVKMKYLTYNYRSTSSIIQFANAIMERSQTSIPKVMLPGCSEKQTSVIKPSVRYFPSRFLQDTFIVERIQTLIQEEMVVPHNIAVISPMNQPLFMIEELLTKKQIPNVYLDGKADVKTAKKPWHVSLCTIHKSKGLEWDIVFMMGVSDEMFPRMKTSYESIEESRRLFYVGVTRAKHELHLLYTTLVQNEPFVSRFITEVYKGGKTTLCTYVNMTEKCFAGNSDLDFAFEERSVTKLIEKLDGKDYQYLKQHDIIPTISVTDINKRKQKLYESFSYLPIIQQQDLYSDFGIFLEKLVHREVAVAYNDPFLCTDKHAIMCLANVKMTPEETNVYMQYKWNFKNNMKHLDDLLLSDQDLYVYKKDIQTHLEQHGKFIQHIHMSDILTILRKVRDQAKRFNILPRNVPIFTANFLPQGFEASMQRALETYTDMKIPTRDCIECVWEISKCQKIVTEWRRRLLYKNASIFKEVFDVYAPLYDRIAEFYIPFVQSKCTPQGGTGNAGHIETSKHLEIADDGGLFGELDMRIGNTIIDYKCSISDDIQLQWVVQLLCYKVLCEHTTNQKIDTIAIFNPLRGWYVDINVASWTKHHELVKYLLSKRGE